MQHRCAPAVRHLRGRSRRHPLRRRARPVRGPAFAAIAGAADVLAADLIRDDLQARLALVGRRAATLIDADLGAGPDELGRAHRRPELSPAGRANEQRGPPTGTSAFLLEPALNGRALWQGETDMGPRRRILAGGRQASNGQPWAPPRSFRRTERCRSRSVRAHVAARPRSAKRRTGGGEGSAARRGPAEGDRAASQASSVPAGYA
jgi:hypothetical protein